MYRRAIFATKFAKPSPQHYIKTRYGHRGGGYRGGRYLSTTNTDITLSTSSIMSELDALHKYMKKQEWENTKREMIDCIDTFDEANNACLTIMEHYVKEKKLDETRESMITFLQKTDSESDRNLAQLAPKVLMVACVPPTIVLLMAATYSDTAFQMLDSVVETISFGFVDLDHNHWDTTEPPIGFFGFVGLFGFSTFIGIKNELGFVPWHVKTALVYQEQMKNQLVKRFGIPPETALALAKAFMRENKPLGKRWKGPKN
jgi:hypothetical protein